MKKLEQPTFIDPDYIFKDFTHDRIDKTMDNCKLINHIILKIHLIKRAGLPALYSHIVQQ